MIYFKSTFSPLCRSSWLSGLSTNDVVMGLIITNVAVFMLWRIADRRFMLHNFTVSPRFINWMLQLQNKRSYKFLFTGEPLALAVRPPLWSGKCGAHT